MDAIRWDSKYSIGIASIDRQHETLFCYINKFYQGIGSTDSRELIICLLNELRNYTKFHFNHEENLMRKFNFSGYNAHVAEHRYFIDRLDEMDRRINYGEIVPLFELSTLVESWIINHIKGTDRLYSDFLINMGVK